MILTLAGDAIIVWPSCVTLISEQLCDIILKSIHKCRRYDPDKILRLIFPFCNTEPTCMPLSGHFMEIKGQVLVSVPYQKESQVIDRKISLQHFAS